MKGELGLHNNGLQDVTAAVAKNHRKSIWKRIVSVLACIVVFCTTYALILPALTLERDAECGLEEHIHTEACYIKDDSNSAEVLVCTAETLGLHQHTDACIGMDGEYICGYGDFVIHSHNEYCYDENGVLVCTLPEIFPHTHTDSCYLMSEDAASELPGGFDASLDNGLDSITGHVHTDECYVNELGELICTLPTEAAHVHTDECYLTTNELCCPLTEGEGHIHGEGCFDEMGELVCTIPESAGHTHTPECYLTSSTLICTLAEGEQVHVHTDECYAQNRVLVCGIPEEPSFVDGDSSLTFPEGDAVDSYATEGLPGEPSFENNITTEPFIIDDTAENGDRGEPICGMTEIIPHRHDDSCFDANGMLICGMTEVLEHIHTQDCMGRLDDSDELTCTIAEGDGAHFHTVEGGCFDEEGTLICEIPESEGHVHSTICYGNWILVCEMEEHTHTDECYSSDEPDADPEREVYCGKEAHTHAGECINENGVVVCTIEEHKHGEECYVNPYADLETFCGKVEHIHADECFDENGLLVCVIEEHLHGEECYVSGEEHFSTLGEIFAFAEVVETNSFESYGIMTMAIDGLPQVRETPHDFKPNINSVILQYNNNGVWTNVPEGYKVSPNQEVRFEINYLLPGHTVSSTNANIQYQMPPEIIVTGPWNGDVTNAKGDVKVGSFVLGNDGNIVITFEESFANNNNSGSEINGKVYIKGKIDYNLVSGEDKTINFSDTVHIDPIIILKPDSSNLNVNKSGSQINPDGTIDYTVTIESPNGTTHPVKITDKMTNVTLDGDISIVGPDGQAFTPTYAPTVSQGKDEFSFELPEFKPGEKYTITYKGKMPDGYDSSKVNIDTNNNITAESDKNDDTKIYIPVDCNITHTQNYLSKDGVLTSDGSEIEWTITINEGKHDIKGWTLSSDTFNGQPLPASSFPIQILDSNKNVVDTITGLPYTFNKDNSTDTYTITYRTPAEAPMGSNKAENKVVFDDPDPSPGIEVKKEVTINDKFEPVTKTAKSMEIDRENDKLILTWKVRIGADVAAIPANWWYQDNIDYDYNVDHYITDAQFDELKLAVDKAFSSIFGANNYQFNIEKPSHYSGKNKSFKITSSTLIPKGSAIEFEYKTTAEFKGGNQELNYKNSGQVNGIGGCEDSFNYKPLLQKYDDADRTKEQTSHEYKKINNGVLKWIIYVARPEPIDGDIVLTELLPEGLNLQKMEISLSNSQYWKTDITADNANAVIKSWNAQNEGGTPEFPWFYISKTTVENEISVTIPEDLLKYKKYDKIEFYIEAKIPDDYEYPVVSGEVSTAVFTNTAILKNNRGDELDAKSQTQTITKNDAKPPLKKGLLTDTIKNNILPYRLTINPSGKDLLPNSDNPLTLTDTLTAAIDETWAGAVRYELVEGSVQVFECDSEGNKGKQLDIKDFPYTFSETKNQYNNDHYYTITMSVPDETPLIIEYKYKAYTASEKINTNVSNKAVLEGVQSDDDDTKVNKSFDAQQVGAVADQKYVTLVKVDSENNGIYLNNAEFELWKYEPTNVNAVDGYVKIDKDKEGNLIQLITNESGKLDLYVDVNCAYYVKEIKAPDYYKLDETPIHFMLYDASLITTSPETKPVDWTGKKLSTAMTFYVKNESTTTSIKVQKKWVDNKTNKPIDPTVDSITVDLKCKAYDKASKQYIKDIDLSTSTDHAKIQTQITITKADSWLHTVEYLPKYGTVDGKEVYYTYYVEETNPGADVINVSYSDNQSGLTTGTITITNTVDTAPKHELPSTGGGGVAPITALGGGVIGISLLLALVKRAQDKKTRESG